MEMGHRPQSKKWSSRKVIHENEIKFGHHAWKKFGSPVYGKMEKSLKKKISTDEKPRLGTLESANSKILTLGPPRPSNLMFGSSRTAKIRGFFARLENFDNLWLLTYGVILGFPVGYYIRTVCKIMRCICSRKQFFLPLLVDPEVKFVLDDTRFSQQLERRTQP